MRTRGVTVVAVVLMISMVPAVAARAAERESGIQRSPDRKRTLVSKDVEGQRYAITLNSDDFSVTGNVFFTDGGAPKFIVCTRVSGDDFSCSVGDACTSEGRESGIQTVPGADQVLVSKDVEGQRYAITQNSDGTLTGNVFFSATGAAKFIFCEPIAGDTPLYSCAVADTCATASCVGEFVTLPDPVALPSGFFTVTGECPVYQPVAGTISLPEGFFDPASARLDAKEQQVFGALQKTTQVTGVLGAGVRAAGSGAAAAADTPDACRDGGTVTAVGGLATLEDCRVGDTRCSGTVAADGGSFTPDLQCRDVAADRPFAVNGNVTMDSGANGDTISGVCNGTQNGSTAFAFTYTDLPLDADDRGGRAAGTVDVTGSFFPGAFEHVEMSFPGKNPATGEPDPGFAKIVGTRPGPGVIFVFVFDLNLDTGKLTPR